MRELNKLLLSTQNETSISRKQIEAAINKGDNKVHRFKLFKEDFGRIKKGTDEVIVQLKNALKKSP